MMDESIPPLGSDERHEIEVIREELRQRGYNMRFQRLADGWVAALHRQGLKGPSFVPHEFHETALGAARLVRALYESRTDLNSFPPPPRTGPEDLYFWHERGTIIIRTGFPPYSWLVTWLPDDKPHESFTTDKGFPLEEGVPGILRWAVQQPWIGDDS